MKKLFMLLVVLLALRMAGKKIRKETQVIQLLWLLIAVTANLNTPNTAKTRSVENRLNALVPVIFPNTGGTINGNVVTNGSHSVNGLLSANQLRVNTSSGSATMEVNGNGHVTSGLQVDGNHNVGGSVSAAGQVLAGGAVSGATFAVNGNGHVTSSFQVDGVMQLSTGSGMPVASPSNCGSPAGLGFTSSELLWCNSATSTINSVISRLQSAGVLN